MLFLHLYAQAKNIVIRVYITSVKSLHVLRKYQLKF